MNVSLSPQLAGFVRSKVDTGAYASASEVVREALRWFAAHADHPTLLDVQEQQIDRVRARAAIDRLRRLRVGTTLGPDLDAEDLRDEGRR
ncbi:MAG: type II toxin-antitoxin system ParD family antitoxin [Planctomycetes bacterium]|nr:type II toxin-antitoxin system ParD family antitoxin [Planctomycetota bacterium]